MSKDEIHSLQGLTRRYGKKDEISGISFNAMSCVIMSYALLGAGLI